MTTAQGRIASIPARGDGVADRRSSEQAKALLELAHAIRHRVFVVEQAISAELEWDDLDAEAEHFVVFDAEDVARGTARFRVVGEDGREGKAERVAVDAAARGTGLGRALMRALEARARELDLVRLRLNAQVSVLPFYEKLGYVAEGEVFVEAGIDHRAMTRTLSRQSATR